MVVTRAQSKAAQPAQNNSSPNDDEDAPPLNTFTCFPRLPFELRALIWKVICFEPRNVDIEILNLGSVYSEFIPAAHHAGYGAAIPLYSFYSECRPPQALQINRELRAEALKCYKLEFEIEVVDRGFTVSFPPQTYVNFEIDRLS
ncbi:hypothetical protein DL95DRAFT_407960 [Leptodontidium sp. 2 PMI_412]|nr:hypothetical protein DL95DRAFT_407960 [Leptodontidium sp. 2 PMI_412]